MTENAAKRVLLPREAYRHFTRMGVAVVGAVFAFAAEVDTAVGGTHIRDTDAKDVLFADFQGFLRFNDKGSVGSEMSSEELAVKPYGCVRCNSFKTEENTLGDLFFVFDSETLEIEGAILRH